MRTFNRITIFLFWIGISSIAYANTSLTGKRVSLPPNTSLVRAQDNANVRLPGGATVTLEAATIGPNRKLYFPANINGTTYYVKEQTVTAMGLINKTECDAIRSRMSSSNRRDIQRVAQAASRVPIGLNNLKSPHGSWSAGCKNFIQDNGQIGSWGQSFLSSAQRVRVGNANALSVMMQPQLWSLACPNFSNFSDEQKRHFIVAFVATKAQDEASCDANAYNNSRAMPNPPGVGFFQLEGQSRLRNGRSSQYCGGGLSGTQRSLPVDLQFSCASYQIVETQWNRNRPFCTSGGYWQESNRLNGRICKNIRQYPGCRG